VRRPREGLLLGEWCCLGLLAVEPSHGFALARHLAPTGDIGRIWSVSRPLTYRALARLQEDGLIEAVGHEAGVAGGDRTIYRPTRSGRGRLRRWLAEPVLHVRDVRSELLVKLELCRLLGVDRRPLIAAQREVVAGRLAAMIDDDGRDPVQLWRQESMRSVVAFLERLHDLE
jgi:DNA-binding PadR family transcriptional regulator